MCVVHDKSSRANLTCDGWDGEGGVHLSDCFCRGKRADTFGIVLHWHGFVDKNGLAFTLSAIAKK